MFQGKVIVKDGCHILNWNYQVLSELDYSDAVDTVNSQNRPETVSCLIHGGEFHFDQDEGISIVPEVSEHFWK